MKTKEDLEFDLCMDGCELTNFIDENSDKEWNDICDLESNAELYDDEGRGFGYLKYIEDTSKIYKPTPGNIFIQDMVNKFYEAYDIDKNKTIIILFTD